MEEKEIWRDIEGFEGRYQISSLGRVKSLARHNVPEEKIIAFQLSHKGYERIRIGIGRNFKRSMQVHRLVAIAFIPNPDNLPQVNHKDGNKRNNRVDNLEWCTNIENQRHAWENGLKRSCYHSGKPNTPVSMIDPVTSNVIWQYRSVADASRHTGIKRENILKVLRGEREKAGGYIWKTT